MTRQEPEPGPLDTPNCPVCLRPMEPVEAYGGVVMWSCGCGYGYGCDEEV